MKHARTNKIICDNVTYRKSVISRMKGLMFRTTIHPEEAHVFFFKKPARLGFHMFFVFTSIDIIFLNKDKKVVDIKKEFKPFTTYTAQKKALYAIEMKAGIIKENDIQLNDTILF